MRELSLNTLATPRSSGDLQPIIWLTLAGIVALLPAFIFGVPSNLDLSNHFRFAVPFYEAIQQGHMYPGWLAESNAGYGDASFRFYPPGVYYLLALARLISGNWYVAILSVVTIISVTGALGAYLWARQFLPKQVAIWAGVFYVLAPYHINQLYQAFMLAEFAGAAVVPFVLAFTERVCRRGTSGDVAGLAASIAALVLTHLPLAAISLLALPIYAVLRIEREQRWTTLGRLVLAVGLGLAASACYWLTMVVELGWIRADNVKPDPSVDFSRNFVFSTFSPDNLNVWWMNILVFASIAMFWPCVMLFRRSWQAGIKTAGPRAAGILAIVALFFATVLSRPVWSIFTPLQYVQFPWRWLIITSVAASVALASAIPFWTAMLRDKRRPLLLLALGTLIISVAFSALHTVREAQFLDAAKFEATLREIPSSTGVSQWWPVWVKEPWKEMNTVVDAGPRSVSVKSWEPEKRSFQVTAGPASDVRVRTFFYPHWIATAGNQSLKVRPDEDGALLISVPNTETLVNLEFREPRRVYWTAVFSVLGWLMIGLFVVAALRRRPLLRAIRD
ncbi:MAG TPA: 6-pyruvoyl-tetrahydropterin synthase-related protein [Pyrinomonadaceae bacterium]|nr:6-pyruvoyl-tetrahydropterin synthase-related protein [Pyrinomonadaceae bacterium]